MSQQVRDFQINRICEWGIIRIYGFPGDRINGLMGALNRTACGRLLKKKELTGTQTFLSTRK